MCDRVLSQNPSMLTLRDLRRIVSAKYEASTVKVIAEYKEFAGDAWPRYVEDVQRGESVVLFNECVRLLESACEKEARSLPDHELELLWFESDHCFHFQDGKRATQGDWIHGVAEELFSRVTEVAANEDLEGVEDEELFELTASDLAFLHRVIELLQSQLRRSDLTSGSRRGLTRAIEGLRAMPRRTVDLHVVCTLQHLGNGGSAFQSIFISSEFVEFDSGGSTYSPDIGSDSFGGEAFAWNVGGVREGNGDPEIWLMMTEAMISAGTSIKIDDEFADED